MSSLYVHSVYIVLKKKNAIFKKWFHLINNLIKCYVCVLCIDRFQKHFDVCETVKLYFKRLMSSFAETNNAKHNVGEFFFLNRTSGGGGGKIPWLLFFSNDFHHWS